MSATRADLPNMPDLPSGMRWRVEKDAYGRLVVHLEKMKQTIWGSLKWKVLYDEPIERYEQYEAHQIKGRVEAVAKDLIGRYNKSQERERAKDALVGIYGDTTEVP